MPHALEIFDNKRNLVFYIDSQPVFLRVITSVAAAKANPKIADLLGPIAFETQRRLIEQLRSQYPDINEEWFESKKREVGEDKKKNWRESDFSKYFENSENNYTAVALEDEEGNPICATSFTIDDKHNKNNFRLSQDETPFIFFELSQTLPSHSGQGLLKAVRNFILPDLFCEVGFADCYFANSMKVMTARNPENNEVIYRSFPNFVVHDKIFKFAGDVFILPRYRKDEDDFSLPDDEAQPSAKFYKGGKTDDAAIKKFIDDCIEKAKKIQGEVKLEGIFMGTKIESLQKLKGKARRELFLEKDGTIDGAEKDGTIEIKKKISANLKEEPRSFFEVATAGKYGKMKSLGGANEL